MSTVETREALPTGTWSADPVHSDLGFSIEYMAGTFRGTFSTFGAEIADGALSGWAGVASIQVKDPNLEAHLQSPDFFDAERHPRLTFRSHDVRAEGEALTIAGEITIKGHTEPVEIRGTVRGPIGDPFGNERFGVTLETVVDRTVFGLTWNNPLPKGGLALANDVRLHVDLQLVKA
jgi:polyisoprenoid-binding protein YceI